MGFCEQFFRAMTCKFMEITHNSHMRQKIKKQFPQLLLQKSLNFMHLICDALKSALSVDDTLHQKCFESVKKAIRVTRFQDFFRFRKYQSGDKSCRCCGAIHSCISLIAASYLLGMTSIETFRKLI